MRVTTPYRLDSVWWMKEAVVENAIIGYFGTTRRWGGACLIALNDDTKNPISMMVA